ncbi:MAG: hypothetical protein KC547_15790 [Anaerolineae bacterium]|nr:hypothetical protein [Anaerolineae bacterium]MCA9908204.1 hypothetical protein [Anaerolineae bacterium]
MPIHVGWDDHTHVAVRFDLHGFWSWTTFIGAITQANDLVETSEHDVALIFYPDRAGAWHLSSDFLAQLRLFRQKRHPRIRHLIVVLHRGDAVVGNMVKILARILPPASQPVIVETLADARHYIATQFPPAKASQ